MTKEELASMLDGIEYGQEFENKGYLGLINDVNLNGLVIVYGQSDDLMEFEGAIREEVGAWGGTTVNIFANKEGCGVLPEWESFKDYHDDEEEFKRYFVDKQTSKQVASVWDKDGYSWFIDTDIPHAGFNIMEDGEKYCRAIVISLDDVK